MTGTDAAVAVYWDFENVHACLLDEAGGENTYRSTARYKPQDVVVDIARVVEYAATLGRVVAHRAYANWQYFAKYKDDLQTHAIDTVQLFPLTSSAKNGADIRLSLDAAEDLRHYPHITHVVVVSSDSDFTALAQRCRTYGRQFVGVGTARTARGYLHACDEFRRYHEIGASARFVPPGISLPAESAMPTDGTATLEDAARLVVAAVRRIAAESGELWVRKAAVLPMVKRLDPAFDVSALGLTAFSDLVVALGSRIVERGGKSDHELAVRADLPGSESESATPSDLPDPRGPIDPSSPAWLLDAELRKKKQRLPADKRLLWSGPELIAEVFAASRDGIEPSFDSLWLKFEAAAATTGSTVSEADFRKLKAILWRAYAFEPLGHDQGLRLRVPDAAELRLRSVTMLLRQLPDPAGVEVAVLAEVMFGPDATTQQQELISSALASLAERPNAAPDLDAVWPHEDCCPDETTDGEEPARSAAA
jgi:uncharacterized LabA/DUF88 family protein